MRIQLIFCIETDEESRSVVIYCFDCDDYDIDPEASLFLEDVKQSGSQPFFRGCKTILLGQAL